MHFVLSNCSLTQKVFVCFSSPLHRNWLRSYKADSPVLPMRGSTFISPHFMYPSKKKSKDMISGEHGPGNWSTPDICHVSATLGYSRLRNIETIQNNGNIHGTGEGSMEPRQIVLVAPQVSATELL